MFAGLVEEVARVRAVEDRGGASLISLDCQLVLPGLCVGDSLAVNGVCQEVVSYDQQGVQVCAYQQTLRKTNLGFLQIGDRVNLERALPVGGRLSGHLIQGQVSGTALLLDVSQVQGNIYFRVEVGAELLPYCLSEGAICLDGMSLTIAQINGCQLSFNPPQQSWQRTNLPFRQVGDRLNVESDLVGRYVAAFLERQPPRRSALQALAHTVPEVEVGLPTEHGDFTLSLLHCPSEPAAEHLLLSLNLLQPQRPETVPLVRIHSECLTGEVFRSQRCDCHWQLHAAMDRIQQEGCGAVIYLRQEGRGIGLRAKLQAYKLQQVYHLDTVEANLRLGYDNDLRSYAVAVDTLRLLQLRKLRLLTNNPDKIVALREAGFEVERVPLEAPFNSHNQHYLETKKVRSGHLLTGVADPIKKE